MDDDYLRAVIVTEAAAFAPLVATETPPMVCVPCVIFLPCHVTEHEVVL